MSWTSKISGCFGFVDKKFALHNTDRTHAQQMLSEALLSNVGFAEYREEIEFWLKSQNLDQEHIAKQMKRVSNLDSYFQYD